MYLCIAFLAAATLYGAEAEYLGGTVKSVPTSVTGKLDLSDPDDLVFAYGKGVYRLPFERIKSFQWEHAKAAPRRAFGRVQIPHLPWGKQDEILNLSYRTDGATTGILSFSMPAKDLPATEWALKCRTEEPQAAVTTAHGIKLPESWWGDRYWRTNRTDAATTK